MLRTSQIDEEDVYKLHERFSVDVYTFCRLYLGEEDLAQELTAKAFVDYIRAGNPLDVERLPVALLKCAWDTCKHHLPPRILESSSAFEQVIAELQSEERAVLILRGVLGIQSPWVCAVTGFSYETVSQLWTSALLSLRDRWLTPTRPGRKDLRLLLPGSALAMGDAGFC